MASCRHDETMKLIGIRDAMVDQLLTEGKTRKPSWKDIAAKFNATGFDRNPEQCSSMWSSLVKKYEVVTYSCSSPNYPSCVLPLNRQRQHILSCQCGALYVPRQWWRRKLHGPDCTPLEKEWSYFEAMDAVMKKQAKNSSPQETKERDRRRTKRSRKSSSSDTTTPQLQEQEQQ